MHALCAGLLKQMDWCGLQQLVSPVYCMPAAGCSSHFLHYGVQFTYASLHMQWILFLDGITWVVLCHQHALHCNPRECALHTQMTRSMLFVCTGTKELWLRLSFSPVLFVLSLLAELTSPLTLPMR